MSQSENQLPKSVLYPYTGGYTAIVSGYAYELCPDHPKANAYGFVPQHRLVVERHQGRYLAPKTDVHHKDHDKLNNDIGNLQCMTRGEHMALHNREKRIAAYGPMDRSRVQQELQKGGLKSAARALGVCQQTIRNNFPDLVAPYKRKSPSCIDDPEVIQKVLAVSVDDKKGYREVAAETGISYRTCQRICERNGIPWTRKSKKGEVHPQYRRKKPTHSE